EQGYTGDGQSALAATLGGPKGLAYASDDALYVADTENHVVRRLDLRSAVITTVLGTGHRGDGPDGHPPTCGLARPHGALFAGGSLYVADSEAHRIRVIRWRATTGRRSRAEKSSSRASLEPVSKPVSCGPSGPLSAGRPEGLHYSRPVFVT